MNMTEIRVIKPIQIFFTVFLSVSILPGAGNISDWDHQISHRLEGSNHYLVWDYIWESVSLSTPLIELGITAYEMNFSHEQARNLGASLLATQLAVGAGKYIIKRQRPERFYRPRLWNTRITPSFPSGHSASSAAAAAFISVSRPELAAPSVIYAFLSGYSQVYVGNHFVSDVLAGWALGSLIGWTTAKIIINGNEKSADQKPPIKPLFRLTIYF